MRGALKDKSWTLPIVLPIAVLFSSLTLLIIESWIRFLLFGFEILAIMLGFFLIRTKGSFSVEKNYSKIWLHEFATKYCGKTFPSLALITMSSILLILLSLNIDGGIIQLFFAMATGSFVVGYVTLNMIGLRNYFTTIEFCILSFLTSIAFTGFSFIALNHYGNTDLWMNVSFLIVGIISLSVTLLIERKGDLDGQIASLSRPLDVLAISLCVGFYLIFVALLYPDAASLIGTDISRHFSYASVLSRTPDLYSGPLYFLYHSFQGSIYLLSGENQSAFVFLSSFAFLNIFLPLSLYAGSKRLLGAIDPRIPGIAVIFYTFLSNLSFLYYMTVNIVNPGDEYFSIVREVSEKSYFSISNLLQPFAFVGPLTISVILVLILISIIKNTSIPKYRYILLVSVLVASGGLIHVPEIALFVLLVSLYSIINTNTFGRVRETLVAMSIGLSGSAAIIGFEDLTNLRLDVLVFNNMMGAFLLTVLVSVTALILNYKNVNLTFLSRYLQSRSSGLIEGSVLALAILYLIGIALWFFAEDLKTSSLQDIGTVPSFLFPMLVGVVGLLAIFSLRSMKSRNSRGAILFLLFAILLLFITGKVLSFVNINFSGLPYWEKRMPGLIFAFASMLAPVIVINVFDHVLAKRRNIVISALILTSILASIILSGFSSLATQIEYWYIRAKGERSLGMQESNAVEILKKIVDQQHSSVTVSPSEFSRHAVVFAAPTYQFSKPDVLFSSMSPEVPLMIMGGLPYDRIYVYIHNRDLDILDGYPNSWVSKHLLPSLPVLYKNEEVRIYNATGLKSPQPRSETAIAIPTHSISDKWLYPYIALSKSLNNYTEIFDQEISSSGKQNNIILTTDPISSFIYYLDLTSKKISQDFWRTRGEWEQRSEGLRAIGNYSGSSGNDNMLISDFTSNNNNMTLSTLFKINNEGINRGVSTSVSFVLSWINQTDFDLAGVAFKDHNVYVYFSNIRNSEVTLYPQFPYSAPLFTGLKWNSGSVFNMTVSVNGDVKDLYINGTKYLSRTTTDRSPGFTGISTSGANDIIFKGLTVSAEEGSPGYYDEYYRYVAGGGNLTVFNTIGYGAIFDMVNGTNNSIAGRPSEQQSNAFTYGPNLAITKTRLGMGNIEYVDIYKVLTNDSMSEQDKNSLLENITNTIMEEEPDPVHQNTREIPMIFQNIKAIGDINMNTSFIAFPNGINGKLVGLRTSDNPNLLPLRTNLTWLKSYGYDTATVYSDDIALLRSGGLYSDLILGNQTITIGFDPKTSVQVGISNGSQSNFENVTSILLEISRPLKTVMRTPEIRLDGNALFSNLHAARLTGIDGEDGIFNGRISFNILASDAYTLSDNVSFTGTFDTPKKYDELSILGSSVFVFDIYSLPPIMIVLLAIPFILTAIFLFYRRIF